MSKYLGHYRGRLEQAIDEFADWLNLGDDKFSYRLSEQDIDNAEGGFNIPEEFDRTLLEVGPDDLVDNDTAATTATIAPFVDVASSSWNSLRWGHMSAGKPSESLDAEGESQDQLSWLNGHPKLETLEDEFVNGYQHFLPPGAPTKVSDSMGTTLIAKLKLLTSSVISA